MPPESNSDSCGALNNGLYPLVFTSLPASTNLGTLVNQCLGSHMQHVYRMDTNVNAHPAAVYLRDEPNPDCL